MENVVYFLGAGFSAPLGLPVMSSFLEKAKDIYFVDMVKDEIYEKAFELLNNLHKIKSDLNTDLSNIEEVLSIITMREQIENNENNKIFIEFIIKVIRYYQSKINFNFLEETIEVNDLFIPVAIGPGNRNDLLEIAYGLFILSLFNIDLLKHKDNSNQKQYHTFVKSEKANRFNNTVITLNYDTIIENFINRINAIVYSDKLSIEFNKKDENNIYSEVKLLKLHGCIEKQNIIPPTWSKIFNSNSDISRDWKQALVAISEAQHIRFIGYSLPETDGYIKYLFKAAMINSYHLKTVDVICIDKNGEVKDRFLNFIPLQKLRFFNGPFEDFLNYNSGNWYSLYGAKRFRASDYESHYSDFWKI